VLLIPRFGLLGAATSMAALLVAVNALMSVALFRLYGIHPLRRAFVLPVAVAAAVSTTAFYLSPSVGMPPALAVALWLTAFTAITAACVVLAGGVEPDEWPMLARIADRAGLARLADRLRSAARDASRTGPPESRLPPAP
jgi:hypothetical protein